MPAQVEGVPLLTKYERMNSETLNVQGYTNSGFEEAILEGKKVTKTGYWEEEVNEDQILLSNNKNRKTSLVANDSIIMALECLQFLSIIMSLALRWPWPQSWIQGTAFVFVFNLDVWDLTKLATPDVYESVQNYEPPTSDLPLSFWYILAGWGGILLVLVVVFVAYAGRLHAVSHPFLHIKMSRIQRVYVIIAQVVTLPLGTVIARLFHCNPMGSARATAMYMTVDNSIACFSLYQWISASLGGTAVLVAFIGIPLWMIKKTKREILFAHQMGHEAHLQLKEMEFSRGLDVSYVTSSYHIFSSFTLRGVYTRSVMFFLKIAVLVVYAALYQLQTYQTMILTIIFFIVAVSLIFVRPYRVRVFNWIIVLNMFCLMLFSLTGALRTTYDVTTIRSAWFTPQYVTVILALLTALWWFVTLGFFVYLLLRRYGALRICFKLPLWPFLSSKGIEQLDPTTKKFMRGLARARHITEKAISIPALFAPAHELSRHIQVINAYCREAELLGNPLQDALWLQLDNLIATHSRVNSESLFSDSVKDSVRQTAVQFMILMPSFARRLAQREYDTILIPPVKRRMLLKMYILGIFLNGRRTPKNKKLMNKPGLETLWESKRLSTVRETSDNDFAQLIPEEEMGPRVGHLLETDLIDLFSYETDDAMSDTVSINISEMMQGIPDLQSSHDSLAKNSRHSTTPGRSAASLRGSAQSMPREERMVLQEEIILPGSVISDESYVSRAIPSPDLSVSLLATGVQQENRPDYSEEVVKTNTSYEESAQSQDGFTDSGKQKPATTPDNCSIPDQYERLPTKNIEDSLDPGLKFGVVKGELGASNNIEDPDIHQEKEGMMGGDNDGKKPSKEDRSTKNVEFVGLDEPSATDKGRDAELTDIPETAAQSEAQDGESDGSKRSRKKKKKKKNKARSSDASGEDGDQQIVEIEKNEGEPTAGGDTNYIDKPSGLVEDSPVHANVDIGADEVTEESISAPARHKRKKSKDRKLRRRSSEISMEPDNADTQEV